MKLHGTSPWQQRGFISRFLAAIIITTGQARGISDPSILSIAAKAHQRIDEGQAVAKIFLRMAQESWQT